MNKTIINTICIIYFSVATLYANLHRVNNNPGITLPAFGYTNFTSAHSAAVNGDTIYIEPSNFNYQFSTITKRLIIIGPGYLLDQNTGTPADKSSAKCEGVSFTTGSNNSVLSGLEIVDANNQSSHIIVVSSISLSIIRCKFSGLSLGPSVSGCNIIQCLITGRLILGSASITNSVISNNIIFGHINNVGSGTVKNNLIYDVPTTATDLQLFNNIFVGNGLVSDTLKAQSVYNNVCVNCVGIANNNNFYTTSYNTIFQVAEPRILDDLEDGRFQLSTASPAKTKGVAGADCGPFGGTNPYVLSGIPAFPSITAITVGAQSGGNIPITFSAKRNN